MFLSLFFIGSFRPSKWQVRWPTLYLRGPWLRRVMGLRRVAAVLIMPDSNQHSLVLVDNCTNDNEGGDATSSEDRPSISSIAY